jgi:LacI family transcriptional regulator
MRARRTGVIGLIVPDVVLSPYVEVVQHLFHLVEREGKELQIALTEFYPNLEDRAFQSMLSSRVDGIIAKVGFARWEDVPAHHYLRRAKDEGITTVLYSNPIEGSGLPYMRHVQDASIRIVTRHLLGLGHRRIGALLPGCRPFGTVMQQWLVDIREEIAVAGNGAELEAIGLAARDDVNPEGPTGVFRDYMNQNHPRHVMAAGREAFRTAMALPNPPTAIVAFSDPMAIGAIFEAQQRGVRIGRDIAIAGCGQTPSSFLCPLTLTTIDRRPQLYAEKLMELLRAHMDPQKRANAPLCAQVDPLLVIGESTVGA